MKAKKKKRKNVDADSPNAESKPTLCLFRKKGNLFHSFFFWATCRCIAVKTTLSEETLKTAGPSLIRNEIGNVSLHDILGGGSDGYSM